MKRRVLHLAYVVNAYGERGRVDRIEHSIGLWHGEVSRREGNSVVVRREAGAVAQFIALTGHDNDGANGQPLAPTMEVPF